MVWDEFLERVRAARAVPADGEPPADAGLLRPLADEQVLINLLKNAHESGSAEEEIAVAIRRPAEAA